MSSDFNGTMMCERLPREIRDNIYELAWTTHVGSYDWLYHSYLDLVKNPPCRPRPYYNYNDLPKVLITPIREQDLQVARELVEWLYENTDLGYCKFYNFGVYLNGPQLPSVGCWYGRPEECDFPAVTAQALEDVLNTDVFGVGVKPADCKLRALSISAVYEVQCDVNIGREFWPQTFSELEALTKIVPTLLKKHNFQLRIMTAAVRHIRGAESPKRYPEPRLARDLKNVTNRVSTELAQTGMIVLPSYFEYDLHRDWDEDSSMEDEDGSMEDEDGSMEDEDGSMEDEDGSMEDEDGSMEDEDGSKEEEYLMIKAIGAENLPGSDNWLYADDLPAEFVKWEDAFSPDYSRPESTVPLKGTMV